MRWILCLSGVAALCTLAACGGDEDAVEPARLVGAWNAVTMTFTNPANPVQKVEVIALDGSCALTLDEDGTYTLNVGLPGETPEQEQGAWQAGGEVLTLTENGMPFSVQFDMALSGNTLTLSGGHVLYDFDENGTPDEALLDLVLRKVGG